MKLCLAIVAGLLILHISLFAQQPVTEPLQLTCPLDGHRFTWPVPLPAERHTSTDSDLCMYRYDRYDAGRDIRIRDVVTCPHCNYTALLSRFTSTTLDEKTKARLLTALTTSTYRGIQDSLAAIPAWERCRLGRICAEARGLEPSKIYDFVLLAVYALRVKSTRLAYLDYPDGEFPKTLDNYAALKRRMLDETDPAHRAQYKLELAMLAQRLGYPGERDEWLNDASKDPGTTPTLQTSIDTFRRMVKLETAFQRDLVKLYEPITLEKALPPDRRNFFTYLQADTLRRLGELDQAAALFSELRDNTSLHPSMREYMTYFVGLLKDHLPPRTEPLKDPPK